MSYKTTIVGKRSGSATSNLLYPVRGSIVASSTASGNAFNVADQNPNTQWKGNAGTPNLRIDFGQSTPVLYLTFYATSQDTSLSDVDSITVWASQTGAFGGEELTVLDSTT